MEVYSLTSLGRALAHSVRSPHKPEWGVIYFMAKNDHSTKEKILSYVPTATTYTLVHLKNKGIIREETGCEV